MNVDPVKDANHLECIRCGNCRKACPKGAIELLIAGRKFEKINNIKNTTLENVK